MQSNRAPCTVCNAPQSRRVINSGSQFLLPICDPYFLPIKVIDKYYHEYFMKLAPLTSDCMFKINPRDPLHLLCSYRRTFEKKTVTLQLFPVAYSKNALMNQHSQRALTTEPKKKGDGIAGVATSKVPGYRLRRPDPHLDPRRLHIGKRNNKLACCETS